MSEGAKAEVNEVLARASGGAEGEGGLGREVVEVNGKEVGGGGKGGARK